MIDIERPPKRYLTSETLRATISKMYPFIILAYLVGYLRPKVKDVTTFSKGEHPNDSD
jgi:hypothetical protein